VVKTQNRLFTLQYDLWCQDRRYWLLPPSSASSETILGIYSPMKPGLLMLHLDQYLGKLFDIFYQWILRVKSMTHSLSSSLSSFEDWEQLELLDLLLYLFVLTNPRNASDGTTLLLFLLPSFPSSCLFFSLASVYMS